MADAADLKSAAPKGACRFESGPGHHAASVRVNRRTKRTFDVIICGRGAEDLCRPRPTSSPGGAIDHRDPRASTGCTAHPPLRRRTDVPAECARLRGRKDRPAGPADGSRCEDVARPDQEFLRAGDHGHRGARAVGRHRLDLLHGRAGGRGALARGRLLRCAGRCPEHAGEQRDPEVGHRGPEGQVPHHAGGRYGRCLRSVRGGFWIGCVRARLPRRRQRRPLRPERTEAVDHERG